MNACCMRLSRSCVVQFNRIASYEFYYSGAGNMLGGFQKFMKVENEANLDVLTKCYAIVAEV